VTLNERSFRITIVVCYSLPRIRFPIGGQSIVTIALLHTWSIAIQHNLTDCNLRWDKKEKLVTVLAADTCSSAVSSCQGRLFDEVWQQCCGYVQLSNDPSSRRLHNKVHPFRWCPVWLMSGMFGSRAVAVTGFTGVRCDWRLGCLVVEPWLWLVSLVSSVTDVWDVW